MDHWLDRLKRGWASRWALKRSGKAARSSIEDARLALATVDAQCQELLRRVESIVESAPKRAPTLIQVSQALESHAQPIRETVHRELARFRDGLEAKANRLDKFTVTLFGRTMAGKSTIREAITGGDGSTIGKGDQRTTRDIREYEWRNISLVDTPGFGAFEGADDRETAFTKVDESDLILFLLSSDGIQEESFREMDELNRLRKPVLFVLNIKLDLTRDVLRRRFLENPAAEMGPEAIKGHLDRIQELVECHFPSTLHEVRVLPVHAQAAWMSGQPAYRKDARRLRAASGIVSLLHALEDELMRRGRQRRVQTIVGGSSTVIRTLAEDLWTGAEAFRLESGLLSEKVEGLGRRIDAYVGAFPGKCGVEVAAHYAPLREMIPRFVDENIHRKDVEDRWAKEVSGLDTDGWAQAFSKDVAGEIERMLEDFRRELDFDLRMMAQGRCAGVSPARPVDWKRVARWTAAALVMTGTVLFFLSTPAGWVTGTLAGVGAGLSIVAQWLPGRRQQIAKAKGEARRKLEAELARYEKETQEKIEHWFANDVQGALLASVRNEAFSFLQGVEQLSAVADSAALLLREMDDKLVRTYQKCLTVRPLIHERAVLARPHQPANPPVGS